MTILELNQRRLPDSTPRQSHRDTQLAHRERYYA